MSEEKKKRRRLSPAAKEAARKRMEAYWANKRAAEAAAASAPEPSKEIIAPSQELGEQSTADLERQVGELKDMLLGLLAKQQGVQPQQGGAQVSGTGAVVGINRKFSVKPEDYPDPRVDLLEMFRTVPKLQGFAFDHNYELSWEVATTRYQNAQGVWNEEPRFMVELHGIMRDDEGNPTNRRYVISKASFFEDPAAAIAIAREQGVEIPEGDIQKTFLDSMRVLRIRDWLLENFYPPKITNTRANRKEMVIGNKLVEVFEVSSQDSQEIPFNQLNKKL